MQLKAKNTSLKQRLRSQSRMSEKAEQSKTKLLEWIKQGRWSEKKPTEKETRKQKYADAVEKNPPARIDEIAKFMGKPDGKYSGLLAAYRKMEDFVILWIKDDPSKLPYVVRKRWLEDLQKK